MFYDDMAEWLKATVCKTVKSWIRIPLSSQKWSCGRVVRLSSAKAATLVQIQSGPQKNMGNKKPTRKEEEAYAAFLKKRLDSSNYKNSVSTEEYDKTKQKYEKVKLKLRLL